MLDIWGRGEFTIHFCSRDLGVHWLSFARKLNALVMPEGGGGPGISNDWCIMVNRLVLCSGSAVL